MSWDFDRLVLDNRRDSCHYMCYLFCYPNMADKKELSIAHYQVFTCVVRFSESRWITRYKKLHVYHKIITLSILNRSVSINNVFMFEMLSLMYWFKSYTTVHFVIPCRIVVCSVICIIIIVVHSIVITVAIIIIVVVITFKIDKQSQRDYNLRTRS